MAIPTMAPTDKDCCDGDDDINVEGVIVGDGREVQNPFQVSAHSSAIPTGGELVNGILCGFVFVFGPGACAKYHSLSPALAQLTPMKAACRKACPGG